MKPLAIISHGSSITPGIATEVYEDLGIPFSFVAAWEEPLPAPEATAGVIVLGGKMNADQVEEHPHVGATRSFIVDALEAGVPVLGICLGAQSMARALGATVRQSPRPEIGFHKIEASEAAEDDPVLGGFASGAPVFQWHEDTFDLPDGATLLYSGNGLNQAFRYGERAFASQFHFEVTEREITAWAAETPPDEMHDHWGSSIDDLLEEALVHLATQEELGREAFARFGKLSQT